MTVRVKICGVTRPEDALRAAELGADFLGLNFYPGSPRCLSLERAREVGDAVRGKVQLVGVFVNPDRKRVEEAAAVVGLDLLQFHGDETAADLAPFAGRAIKVFRLHGPPTATLVDGYSHAWGFLFDVRDERRYGGTGVSWRYGSVAGLIEDRPFFIAGGIGPDNARRAVTAARAWGIDVCSGVESSPGVKNPTLLEQLMREVGHGQGQDAT